MVKSELARLISEQLSELEFRDVEVALHCILNQMTESLAQGERIEVRGFGSFGLHHRPPRLARNPKTGEAVSLPASVAVHFKPGKEIRDRINSARLSYKIAE